MFFLKLCNQTQLVLKRKKYFHKFHTKVFKNIKEQYLLKNLNIKITYMSKIQVVHKIKTNTKAKRYCFSGSVATK